MFIAAREAQQQGRALGDSGDSALGTVGLACSSDRAVCSRVRAVCRSGPEVITLAIMGS